MLGNVEAIKDKEKFEVPDFLIYEKSGGEPVYYRGYEDVLKGRKKIEEIMGSSYLQVFIIMTIVKHLIANLSEAYLVFTNEVGVIHEEGNWRLLDIAIYRKEDLKGIPLENKYLRVPPEVVIEIDTKADIEKFTTAMDYVYGKTDDLIRFGAKKIIWIFTSSRKILIAAQKEKWITIDWNEPVPVIENIAINIEEMIKNAAG